MLSVSQDQKFSSTAKKILVKRVNTLKHSWHLPLVRNGPQSTLDLEAEKTHWKEGPHSPSKSIPNIFRLSHCNDIIQWDLQINSYSGMFSISALQNIFFSPFSISACLGMIFLGSSGSTAQQLLQTLKFNRYYFKNENMMLFLNQFPFRCPFLDKFM